MIIVIIKARTGQSGKVFFTKTFLQVLENRAADAEGKVKVVDINKVEI